MTDVTITGEEFRELMLHTHLLAAAMMHGKIDTELDGEYSVACQLYAWTDTLLRRHLGGEDDPRMAAYLEVLHKQYVRYFDNFKEGDDDD
tara:strand:+ start:226 stop:495 length:270 start_codon:yes stop_codon:yes gene_type:complete